MDRQIFGKDELVALIRERRKRQNISQSELANFAGLTVRGVNKIEKGHTDPKFSTLIKLAQLVGIRIFAKAEESLDD